ncbi:MAG: hypothetical protein GYB37_14405 [Algicola sp.]|nr:hypothetical protein [Algicola sp.]
MANYKFIRVKPESKEMIKKLSKNWGKTETDFANHMIQFIFETKMDVYGEKISAAPDLIKDLDRRIVSFLKKREHDFFVPMQSSFREMIKLHNQTLQTLDILHPGEIGLDSKRLVNEKEKPTFNIPDNESSKSTNQKPFVKAKECLSEKTLVTSVEKEEFLIRIERAEKEKATFEKELQYLLNNIVPNKSISGPKFTCNLPQKEIDRIKLLLS